jgi:ATP-dependent exoDNAse (exonuclease V) alpha subunit
MLDQDTALALLTIADERGWRLALIGDRHQLPAVGRGGVLEDTQNTWAVERAAAYQLAVSREPTPYRSLSRQPHPVHEIEHGPSFGR